MFLSWVNDDWIICVNFELRSCPSSSPPSLGFIFNGRLGLSYGETPEKYWLVEVLK